MRTLCLILSLLFALPVSAADKPRKLHRGAKRSPAHKLLAAPRFKPVKAPPAQVAYVPAKLDMWGNDQYGDCVSAEEAFAKACYSPEIFIDSATVVAWAQANGYLDGADLASVLQSMQSGGFKVGQQQYNDGAPATVDYTTEAVLQAAIAQGPVKIAIDSTALPQTAGAQQGWYAFGGKPGQFPNTDHCVSIAGYGPVAWLAQQLGVAVPPGAPTNGYLVFTWSTIGIVDFAWLQSTCVEAWVRNPTTVGVPPLLPPVPPAPPTPTPPTPPGPGPTPPTPTPGAPTLVTIVATFSDGSTQTLGGQAGLSAAQLQSMTLQQIQAWIATQQGRKPCARTAPAAPAKPAPAPLMRRPRVGEDPGLPPPPPTRADPDGTAALAARWRARRLAPVPMAPVYRYAQPAPWRTR